MRGRRRPGSGSGPRLASPALPGALTGASSRGPSRALEPEEHIRARPTAGGGSVWRRQGQGEERESHLAGKQKYLLWRILECLCRRQGGGKCSAWGGGRPLSIWGTSKKSFKTAERHLVGTWRAAPVAEAGRPQVGSGHPEPGPGALLTCGARPPLHPGDPDPSPSTDSSRATSGRKLRVPRFPALPALLCPPSLRTGSELAALASCSGQGAHP